MVGITLYQEWKSEKAVEALRSLSSPRALVVRDGVEVRIAGNEVVPGDLLIVSEGDRIAADAVLQSSPFLKVDESILTGESIAVEKATIALASSAQIDAPQSRLYSGTLVVAGHGYALVTETGRKTQIGKIGQSLAQKKDQDQTLLQRELGKLARIFGFAGIGVSLLIVLIYGMTQRSWLQGLLAGLSIAMSLLPEEFPVILTVFLAMGAWRISKANVLTRRISATESLGSITVLCVDKTGTLTKNQMEVGALDVEGKTVFLREGITTAFGTQHEALLRCAALASPANAFDPMEKAIRKTFEERLPAESPEQSEWQIVREYPLSSQLLAVTIAWKTPRSQTVLLASKGAPEAILRLCRIQGSEAQRVLAQVQRLAEQGLRVLGVATHELQVQRLSRLARPRAPGSPTGA